MSAVLRAAKIMRVSRAHPGVFARYHRGDPGLLDGLWNGIKGAVTGFIAGGPAGAIIGGTQGLVGKGGAPTSQGIQSTLARLTGQKAPTMPGGSPAINVTKLTGDGGMFPQLPNIPPLFPGDKSHSLGDPTRGNQTQSGGGVQTDWNDRPGEGSNSGRPCHSGYHWNKSGYYTKKYGWIERGTVCVKNRKRNPLNPRAASRALGRLVSTRKAMKGIERLMNKIGGSRPARMVAARSNGRKRGCGCK